MRLLVSIQDEDNAYGVITGTAVTDEECPNSVYCPICVVKTPTRSLQVVNFQQDLHVQHQ